MSDASDRIHDVLRLVRQAQALLDQAVGRGVRLGAGDQELVRRYILEPRNHLRNSTDRLRRVMEVADVRARENRRPD